MNKVLNKQVDSYTEQVVQHNTHRAKELRPHSGSNIPKEGAKYENRK